MKNSASAVVIFAMVFSINVLNIDSLFAADRIDELEKSVEALSARVEQLEKLLEKLSSWPPQQKLDKRVLLKGNWDQLSVGMSEKEVEEIIGHPDSIDAFRSMLGITSWHYTDKGQVGFKNGQVESWKKPPRR